MLLSRVIRSGHILRGPPRVLRAGPARRRPVFVLKMNCLHFDSCFGKGTHVVRHVNITRCCVRCLECAPRINDAEVVMLWTVALFVTLKVAQLHCE